MYTCIPTQRNAAACAVCHALVFLSNGKKYCIYQNSFFVEFISIENLKIEKLEQLDTL